MSNPEYAIRMHEAFSTGKVAGWGHADRALKDDPTESAFQASGRLATDRPEDERERFIEGFYRGVDDRLNPRPAPPRLLRF